MSTRYGSPPEEDEPTYATFQAELETVIKRHNDLFQKVPGYPIAMMIQEADHLLGKHNLEVDISERDNGVLLVQIGDGGIHAVFGVQGDLSRLEAFDPGELAMVDHRGADR